MKPGVYAEPPLDHAIFKAKVGVLSGPVHITLGYFDFLVKRVHGGRQKPFAEVQAVIAKELPVKLQEEALVGYTSRWRAKWRARTHCSAGYVVQKCSGFKATPLTQPEDPYTIN